MGDHSEGLPGLQPLNPPSGLEARTNSPTVPLMGGAGHSERTPDGNISFIFRSSRGNGFQLKEYGSARAGIIPSSMLKSAARGSK